MISKYIYYYSYSEINKVVLEITNVNLKWLYVMLCSRQRQQNIWFFTINRYKIYYYVNIVYFNFTFNFTLCITSSTNKHSK